jgi:hypothetical protein
LASLKEQQFSRNLKAENENSNRFFVKFCYKFSETDASIKKWKDSLESVEGEDAEWMRSEIRGLQDRMFLLRQLLQGVPTLDEEQLNELYNRDLMQIPLHQRWMMYNSWKLKALEIEEERAAQLEKLYFENANKLKDVRNLESAEICQRADIVGLTTTGAARQRALLNHLKPKIGNIFFATINSILYSLSLKFLFSPLYSCGGGSRRGVGVPCSLRIIDFMSATDSHRYVHLQKNHGTNNLILF